MNIDSAILLSGIGSLAACVGYLWREMRRTEDERTKDMAKRLDQRSDELNQCLSRERTLLKQLAEFENGGSDE